jgi:hypothetical protein
MSNLRILGVGNSTSGVTYHRIALPLSTMQKEYCLLTDSVTEEMIIEKEINILVLNRFLELVPITTLIEWKAKHGFKIVVDIDDYWELFSSHVSNDAYRKLNIPNVIRQYIRIADLVTCTHSRLYSEIIKINKNCEILPNALPFDKDQFTAVKIEHDKVNIAHTGSVMHFPDIKQLKNPLLNLSKSKSFVDATRMLLCGWNDYNKWHWTQIGNIYTANEKLNYKIIESAHFSFYMNFYNEADMLVVPLLDNKFNRMKSNLKALEAGAKRIPILTFDRDPYADIPTIFKIHNWEQDIKRMTFSKQMREDYGEANAEYVREHYDLFKINEHRFAIYNKLICQ